jgi:hypothetical protein
VCKKEEHVSRYFVHLLLLHEQETCWTFLPYPLLREIWYRFLITLFYPYQIREVPSDFILKVLFVVSLKAEEENESDRGHILPSSITEAKAESFGRTK